jgi:hypothetical protein
VEEDVTITTKEEENPIPAMAYKWLKDGTMITTVGHADSILTAFELLPEYTGKILGLLLMECISLKNWT